MNLPDRYRPAAWSDVAGHGAALKKLDRLRQHGGLAGRGYWIDGPSGTGKSTITRLLAQEVADDWATIELDALALTPARLRDIERDSAMQAPGAGAVLRGERGTGVEQGRHPATPHHVR